MTMENPQSRSQSRPQSREALIAALTQDLAPVQRVKPRDGAALIAFATIVAGVASIAVFDFWTGMLTGAASVFFWIVNGLLALVGASATAALVSSALPRVGSRGNAPYWSAAMLAVLPVAAIITLLSVEAGHDHGVSLSDPGFWYWECTAYGLVAGALVAVAAVLFLRRGAPVSLERAGWLTGLASGSLGSIAYGITCPLDTVTHVGIWHAAPVAVAALVCRAVVPRLIRW